MSIQEAADQRAIRLSPRVTALGCVVPHGDEERYFGPTGTTHGSCAFRHASVERIFRMALKCGMIGKPRDDDYAVLDCYNDYGDIIEDYGIRSRRGFEFLYRKLNWRMRGDL